MENQPTDTIQEPLDVCDDVRDEFTGELVVESEAAASLDVDGASVSAGLSVGGLAGLDLSAFL